MRSPTRAWLASSRMFATLDPTLRSIALPSRRQALLSDTVGFIRNFAAHPDLRFPRHAGRGTARGGSSCTWPMQQSDGLRTDAAGRGGGCELESEQTPRLLVVNKIDLLPADQRPSLGGRRAHPDSTCRKTGVNLGGLLEAAHRTCEAIRCVESHRVPSGRQGC